MMIRGRKYTALAAIIGWGMLGGCTAADGDICQIDSDCGAGMWCHPANGVCVPVTCNEESGKCQSEEDPIPDSSTEDTAPLPDIVEEADDGSLTDGSSSSDAHECSLGGGATWRVSSFLVGEEGKIGFGQDVDQSPNTCAPADTCSDGIDNAFASLAVLINTFMEDGMEDGDIQLGIHQPSAPCDALVILFLESETGVASKSYSEGSPINLIPNLQVDGDSFSAGPGGTFRMPLSVLGVILEVNLQQVSLSGSFSGDEVHLILGASMRYEDLANAIFSIPEEKLPPSVESQEEILEIIDPLLIPDQDQDGDGVNESLSIGLQMDATAENLVFPNE